MSSDENNSINKIALNLTAACLIAGLIIAGINLFTEKTAKQRADEMKKSAMKTLLPLADNFIQVHGKKDWYMGLNNGKSLGYIIPSESKGYGGTMKLLVAVSTEGKIINYNILESKETPGLGDKAAKEPFYGQFIGKTIANLEVVKDPNNKDDIQAISGATISSRAVADGIKEAVKEVEEMLKKGGK